MIVQNHLGFPGACELSSGFEWRREFFQARMLFPRHTLFESTFSLSDHEKRHPGPRSGARALNAGATIHPTDQTLQSYRLGKLDDRLAGSVSNHLKHCALCHSRVAELSSSEIPRRFRDDHELHEMSAGTRSEVGGSTDDRGPTAAGELPRGDTLLPGLAEHSDYEMIRELGRGGMGVVYLVRNKLMGRLEVLKVVSGHLDERPRARERFLREVQSAAKLQHKHIVTAYSAMRLDKSLILAMEFIDGDDLGKVVKSSGPLPVTTACDVIYQAALGLQHAHERGMVHRDIKPANLIAARDGNEYIVKVLDFGLAKVTTEGQTESGLTREGQLLGTPDFIAPEQIRDAQSADIRADIYSLGCTFYCLLTGKPPFHGQHVWELYGAHLSTAAGPVSIVRPDVPVALDAVVAKMMAKDPRHRYQTPAEAAQALVPFFEDKKAKANAAVDGRTRRWLPYRSSTPASTPKRPGPRSRRAAALALLLVFGVVSTALVFQFKNSRGTIFFANGPEHASVEVEGDSTPFTRHVGEPVAITSALGMTFVPIPPGNFLMGSLDNEKDAYPNEKPQHIVRIARPFYLCASEVTQAQYEAVMGENPSSFSASGDLRGLVAGTSTGQLPVENVSWLQAVEFCNKLSMKAGKKPFYEIDGATVQVRDWNAPGYRLPTEAEWEYACRANAPKPIRYSFGDDDNVAQMVEYEWFSNNSQRRTHPVKQKRPNAFGLYDMHGNVWEWCWDRYEEGYSNQVTVEDPIGREAGVDRAFRGGAYDSETHRTRSAARLRIAPELKHQFLGFRLAMSQSDY
jgi:serine/threonine protein kinase